MHRTGLAVVLAIAGVWGASTASAEPLTLTGGYVVLFDEGSYFRFEAPGVGVGTHNFAVTVQSGVIPGPECSTGRACLPGEAFSFGRSTATDVFFGTPGATSELVLNGHLYENVSFFGSLSLDAPTVHLPTGGQRWWTYHVPFTLTGSLRAEQNGSTIWSSDLAGSGIASSTFQLVNGGRFYQFDAPPDKFITFAINPAAPAAVPEPATMLLIGTGVVGMAGARRRRARDSGLAGRDSL